VIYDISQDIIATGLRRGGTYDMTLLQIYCLGCFEFFLNCSISGEVTGKKADCQALCAPGDRPAERRRTCWRSDI